MRDSKACVARLGPFFLLGWGPSPWSQMIRLVELYFPVFDEKRTPQRGAARLDPRSGGGMVAVGLLLLAPPASVPGYRKFSRSTVSIHTTHTDIHNACGNECGLHYGEGIRKRRHGSMVRSIHRTRPLSAFYPQLVLCTWIHMATHEPGAHSPQIRQNTLGFAGI